MPLRKSAEILVQPLVGGQTQHLMRLSVACFPHRHGIPPAVVQLPGRAELLPSKATLV
jgi:hypothetical protein